MKAKKQTDRQRLLGMKKNLIEAIREIESLEMRMMSYVKEYKAQLGSDPHSDAIKQLNILRCHEHADGLTTAVDMIRRRIKLPSTEM